MLSIINVRTDLPRFSGQPETGKTVETPGYNDVPVCSGDKDGVYMEEYDPKQHDLVVLTGVKQRQHYEVETKSKFPVLRLATPITTQV